MENIIIKTTNGYMATLRPFLPHEGFIQIQKLVMGNLPVSEIADKVSKDLPFPVAAEVLKTATKSVVISIVDSEGTSVYDQDGVFSNIPTLDGNEIQAKVSELIAAASGSTDKKKVKK